MTTAETLAFVFARGGSKGVPRKNLRTVGGVPLLSWSIRAAKESRFVDEVVVSTDDVELARLAESEGAHVPALRPAHLATDEASEWHAWRHAVLELAPAITSGRPFSTFVSVPPTAPLRSPADIDRCCRQLAASAADLVLTISPAQHSPHFNMVRLVGEFVEVAVPSVGVTRRQDTPQLFNVTTVAYATTPAHIQAATGVFDGNVAAVVVPPERALDIDSEWDLHVADLVASARNFDR